MRMGMSVRNADTVREKVPFLQLFVCAAGEEPVDLGELSWQGPPIGVASQLNISSDCLSLAHQLHEPTKLGVHNAVTHT